VFGEGKLIGASASKDIPPKKAYIFIPNKLIISTLSIRSSEIAHVFLDNPKLLKENDEGDCLSLTVFVVYEMLKGIVENLVRYGIIMETLL
jgi:hypothetical protein